MRKFYVFSAVMALVMAFAVSNVIANPKIQQQHAGKKKDGKAVNCGYCHTANKIEKKKGQNVKALEKKPACLGAGCHQ